MKAKILVIDGVFVVGVSGGVEDVGEGTQQCEWPKLETDFRVRTAHGSHPSKYHTIIFMSRKRQTQLNTLHSGKLRTSKN